jgi:RNA polymerase sigma factor (sigma-70 family)
MPKNAAEVLRRRIHTLAAGPMSLSATDRDLLLRFGEHQDEAAFAALFQRHADMVLGTARRIVENAQDAEDVCQAAFLLLAKKATSQRWQSSVANWLYQTTHYLALKARTGANRRARRDRRAVSSPTANPLAEITGQELLAVLEEELLALPGSLRAPLVICCLEGATRDEAAQRLGCSLAALKKRLERGRQQLHAALTRRGLSLGAALIGTFAVRNSIGLAQAKMLHGEIVQAALSLTAGGSVDAVVSPKVRRLLQGGIGTMSSKTFKAAIALLVGGLLSTAVAIAFTAGDAPKDDPPPKKPAEKALPAPVPPRNAPLRYQFRVGDTYRYVVEKQMDAQTEAPGFGRHNAITKI